MIENEVTEMPSLAYLASPFVKTPEALASTKPACTTANTFKAQCTLSVK